MQRYYDTVTDQRGNALAGASVAVQSGGTNVAIYSDDGVTRKSNPMTTDASGGFSFYAANGTYDLVVTSASGVVSSLPSRVRLFDVADAGLATSAALAASSGAALVGFVQSGAGAVARTVQDELRAIRVAPEHYAGSDTVKLKAAFDHCIATGKTVELEGDYTVTGPICTLASVASGSLHIRCNGNVTITVDSGAAAFTDLIYCESTAANNASITGGSLTIDLANKGASGIYIRHNTASQSGVVNFECPVTVLNAKNNDAAATYENQGILIYGDYAKVVMNNPRVVGVDRANTAAGACKGIGIAAFTGEVVINQPHLENILCTGGTADADGLAVFAKAGASTYNRREGRAVIHEPVFIDCQGRSFKSQCSDVTVIRPRVKRQNVVSIEQGNDFDFQFGNGLLIEPDYEYRLNGATSPLGSSFSCVSFQQLLDDAPMHAKSIGGTLRTEVSIPRYAAVVHQSTALHSETEISGLRLIPLGSLTTTVFSRAILETSVSTILAKTAKTKLTVRDVSGPNSVYAIGYTGYTTGDLTSKLSWEVTGLRNTLAIASTNLTFHKLSGNQVLAVESFMVRGNVGYRDFLSGALTFTMNALPVGCSFTVDLAAAVVTGAPGWAASGYAFVECVGQYFADTDKYIRASVGSATGANTVFWTQDGGATWGAIK
jgi:hypothetical protein